MHANNEDKVQISVKVVTSMSNSQCRITEVKN